MGHRHEFLIALLCVVFVVSGCAGAFEPPKPTEPEKRCETACAHLRMLGCSDAQPTKHGASCEEVCKAAGSVDYSPGWPLSCIEAATSCDAARDC